MTANAEHGVTEEFAPGGAGAREAHRRLEDERLARASQLSDLERSVEQTPLDEVEQSDHTRLDNLRASLKEINSAFRRLQDGTYGKCEGCTKAIPPGRLEILPYVRYCVGCQQRLR
ncbi:TraR/DksA family transcriptional regulator [Actinomadura sp. 9N407]|uniref:TraR/DksA family transcriptional regulator n=1 Tax=Actinomadura sp. 9N407 TaxID=3375154 RepID=UPI0037BC92E1